jgi:hypothetical protein
MTKCQISSKQQLLLKCLQTKEYYLSQNIFILLFILLFIIIMFPSYPNLDSIPRRKPKRKKKKKQKRVTLVFLNQTSPTNPVEI